MDWSNVFEDEGEGIGNWVREHELGSRTSMLDHLNGKYNPWICYAFTVNYILGVGCLGIPYAFYQSGIILGTLMILGLSLISYITVMWIAVGAEQEISISIFQASNNPFILSPSTTLSKRRLQERIAAQSQSTEKGGSILTKNSSLGLMFYGSIGTESEVRHTDRGMGGMGSTKSRTLLKSEASLPIRELEVTDLVEEFLGSGGKVAYQMCLMSLTYVGLLAYAQVFNVAFLSQICPSCSRYLPPSIFGALVIPLSCFDLSEQVLAQVIMSLLRFLSLGVLLIGTTVALIYDWDHSALQSYLHSESSNDISVFDLKGFGVMFTTAIFSQLFQHSVPGLIRPLSDEDKKYVPKIFSSALLTTAIIYIASGSVCVLYFGKHLNQSVNLNFVGFTWGINSDQWGIYVVLKFLSTLVVMFPAIDTLSVFPLIAITLGNNLNSAFPQVYSLVRSVKISPFVDVVDSKKITSTIWRLIASIPPVLLSIFVQDLTLSLQIAGLCGIIVALVIPAILFVQTQHRVQLIPTGLQTKVAFQNDFNDHLYVYIVLLIAVAAMCISIFQMCT